MPKLTDYVKDNLPEWVSPSRTALCVIDVQVDFASPDGLMASFGADLSSVPAAVETAGRLVDSARKAGVPVIFVGLLTTPETDSDTWKRRMRRRAGDPDMESAVCRAGTRGADFFGPQPAPTEAVVYKHKYSGFYETDLEDTLNKLGVDTIVACGLTTECCVDSTVRDAFHHDFNVFVATDATAAYGKDMHEGALEILDLNFALLVQTDDLQTAWASQADHAAAAQVTTNA